MAYLCELSMHNLDTLLHWHYMNLKLREERFDVV
jgi:hypothetical protein